MCQTQNKKKQKVDSSELHSLLHGLITLLQGYEPWMQHFSFLRQGVLQSGIPLGNISVLHYLRFIHAAVEELTQSLLGFLKKIQNKTAGIN